MDELKKRLKAVFYFNLDPRNVSELQNMLRWLRENCNGLWRYDSEECHWAFTDEEDAMAFKLMWL